MQPSVIVWDLETVPPWHFDNYLIDVKFGIIMDVEASRAIRQAEVGAAKTMIKRTEF
jgi:hypothetical protein